MNPANNCNDIRLIAAVLVVLSHSFMLTSGSNDHEPMFWLTHGQVTIGGLSVFTFFILSGYLITRSFERSPGIIVFVTARMLRIMPALVVVLFVTAFMLGPCLTTLSITPYFQSTRPFRYFLSNLSLVTYVDGLPGVLPDNPFPTIVNGSLWTLHIEAACYLLVLVLGIMRLLTPLVLAGLFLTGLTSTILSSTSSYPILLITYFLAGASLYRLPMRRARSWAVACAGAIAVSAVAGGFVVTFAIAGAYVVWYVAFSPQWRASNLTGSSDLSYGTYIWAFPVQQTVVHCLGGAATWCVVITISLPVVLVMAWISWTLIEKPALAWKLRRRPQVVRYGT